MEPEAQRKIKTIRKLTMIAAIIGPISLIIGGLVFATAGFVLSLIAFLKARKLTSVEGVPAQIAKTFRVTTMVVFIIDCVIFAIALINFILVMQIIFAMAENGTLLSFMENQLGMSGIESGSASVWG